MNWIIGCVFIIIIISYLLVRHSTRKSQVRLKKELQERWSKPKTGSYFNFDFISAYFRNKAESVLCFQVIDDRTFKDLDLEEIFKVIDHTTSKIGEQYLYFKLRVIKSIEELCRFNKLADIFQNNEKLRVNSQVELSKLSSHNAYYLEELFSGGKPEKPKMLPLLYFLSGTAIFAVGLSFLYPIFFLMLIPVFVLNMVFHYRNKEKVISYINGVSQLSVCLRVSLKLSSFEEVKDFYGDFSFLKAVHRVEKKTRLIGFEKKLDNEYAAVVWLLSELVKIMFNIEYILFYQFLGTIEQEKESIERMFVFIGEIDSAIASASVKSGESLVCKPRFIVEKRINAKGAYHPLIEDCIQNDLNLAGSSLLLTGSNMSGKTTFIRTIGINCILSQTLNFCFASAFETQFFRIYSSIVVSDDVLNGRSYYLQEVLRIKSLIKATEGLGPCLFILDELFKGTNTIERIAAGKAVLSFLNKENHTVLVSTHDIELTELLEKDNYGLYHFSEVVKENELFFDHKLKPGKLKTRNAIKILEINGYPERVLELAKLTENNLENGRLYSPDVKQV